jgi:carotenoid 1,2-hydratase
LSDDGRHGLTVIAFVGSVFSPYYAWARRRAPADPQNHCALNVALYGRPGRWAMTERGRGALGAEASALAIGLSSLRWDGNGLAIAIDEVTAPLPSRLRGTVRVRPAAMTGRVFTLDPGGRHRWWPIAPQARVEWLWRARRFAGAARPTRRQRRRRALEAAFSRWDWCGARLPDRRRRPLRVTAPGRRRALDRDPRGRPRPNARHRAAPPAALPATRWWRAPRETRADAGHAPAVGRTFEDAPFYARSLLSTHLLGRPVTAVHESLSLDRFRAPWVQALLPFRMPRRPDAAAYRICESGGASEPLKACSAAIRFRRLLRKAINCQTASPSTAMMVNSIRGGRVAPNS